MNKERKGWMLDSTYPAFYERLIFRYNYMMIGRSSRERSAALNL